MFCVPLGSNAGRKSKKASSVGSAEYCLADVFIGDFQSNANNEKLFRLTTGDGYRGGPDKAKIDYYFGNIDERRVTWSRGRDLALSPPQDAGPVNALPKADVEVVDKPGAEKEVWTRQLTFKEIKQRWPFDAKAAPSVPSLPCLTTSQAKPA